jgi:alkanesulfonate monooxygenase SsuD/methylene tetrahydromethanopterin reductase-like flavin-dependent oxidoreductase (luciferase family)
MTGFLHTALALDGVGWHPAAWRLDADNARRLHDPDYWLGLARLAEQGHLDLLTIDDTLALQSESYSAPVPRTDRVRGRVDAVLLASRIAPLTTNIGLVPTVVVTHTEPFHAAKALATLDYVSTGRAGVRLKVSGTRHEAKLFGRRDVPDFSLETLDDPDVKQSMLDRFHEAADYTEVLRRLWDSWEDDAEIRDVSTGRFVDRDKLHYIDFSGEWFSIKGPLTVPRPPQGQPIVSVLGHGTDPYRLGALGSDLVYVTPRDDEHALGIVDEIRWIEESVHRLDPRTRVLGDVLVVLGDTEDEARSRLDDLDRLAGEPLRSDALVFAGTPAGLADLVGRWADAGLDGVRFRPATNAEDLPRIVRDVVPELQRRGLQREGYAGPTLRDNLGLSRPTSRYAAQEAS